ncbi:right-handed parallel beta-helix repeat-containing protein [Phaeodactylibacter xiamenensis]|uniref:right-handed parallel beta-helix repeat-containing protein n=1 Tax=Phaeodactylibacter xiamenensis TaxID=1524460 RepID=UPI0024A9CA86|nr:right-handed parallel beta-helix repeat-containing protein [Phaeodactylibacter xiamenensis]
MRIAHILLVLTLLIQTSFGQTTITDSTTVSGNWTVANSPYLIEGRAIVPSGQTLTLEPGVEVRLRSSASPTPSWFDYSAGNVGVIRVEGTIIANGTPAAPIVFTRDNTGFWGTILIDENASDGSSFSNCIIEYAKESRNVPGVATPASFNGSISVYRSGVSISQNVFRHNTVNGLYIRESTGPIVFSENVFHDNGSNGSVIEQSTVNATNNTYHNNSNSASGQVSAIRSSNSTVFLAGNLIYDNDDFGIFTTDGGHHYLVNNTIVGNSQGIRVESGANTYIYSTIVQNNTLNFATGSVGGATVEMQYSLTNDAAFPANVTNVSGNLLGSDAQFTNAGGGDFSLQDSSSAIDAGNPDTTGLNIPSTDILGNPRLSNTIIDIGAIEFQQPLPVFTVTTASNPVTAGSTSGGGTFLSGSNVTVAAVPNMDYTFLNWTENGAVVSSAPDYSFTVTASRNLVANFELAVSTRESAMNAGNLLIYPNPTDGLVNIRSHSSSSVEVFDACGQLVLTTKGRVLDLSNQPAGIYFLKVNASGTIGTIRVIIKE